MWSRPMTLDAPHPLLALLLGRTQHFPVHRDARDVPLRESYLEYLAPHRIEVSWHGHRGAGDWLRARQSAQFQGHQALRDRCCCSNAKLFQRALGGSCSADPHKGITDQRARRNGAMERTCPEVIAVWKAEDPRFKTL